MPKVSIRLMTYNSGKFIAETIESCLNQTFQDFEICIADDASTDDTVAIIQEYQKKFPEKIKLVIQPVNMGQYAVSINGNTSRKMCTGEYVALLDGDDIMLPNRLEEQVKFLDHHQECIAVTHDCETFDSDTGEIYPDFFSWVNTKNRSTSYLIKHGNQVHTPTVMHRNFPSKPFLANTSIKKMADWYFFIELSMKGKIEHQNQILTRYRRHKTNLTNTNFDEDMLITLALIESKYPEFLHEIQEARVSIYISKGKKEKKYYYYITSITLFPAWILIKRITKKLVNIFLKN